MCPTSWAYKPLEAIHLSIRRVWGVLAPPNFFDSNRTPAKSNLLTSSFLFCYYNPALEIF